MQTSREGVAFIAALEGVVTRAYRDVGGTWTIGVGHTAAAGPPIPAAGMTITRADALAILARDLPRYEKRVAAALPGATQTVFDGAVSFDFNTGAVDRASWVTAFCRGEMAAARASLQTWVKAGGRTIAGLARRRTSEARLIFDGMYEPATEIPGDAVRALQTDLAALGFYAGAIDGIAGPTTLAAVIAYQSAHADLVVDGIAGPATRAAISRDLAARRGGLAAAATAAGAGIATTAAGGTPAWTIVAVLAVLAVAFAILAFRYRGAFARLFNRRKGS